MDKVGSSSPVGSHMCAGWTADDFLDLSSLAFISVAVCGLASFSTSSSSKRGRWTTFHTAAAAAKTDQRRVPRSSFHIAAAATHHAGQRRGMMTLGTKANEPSAHGWEQGADDDEGMIDYASA
ncbi:hypothetical protein CF319_g8376 [Tilletia indica]|nr:hypothetical protein CF319_g8376 [Tilletia indica]